MVIARIKFYDFFYSLPIKAITYLCYCMVISFTFISHAEGAPRRNPNAAAAAAFASMRAKNAATPSPTDANKALVMEITMSLEKKLNEQKEELQKQLGDLQTTLESKIQTLSESEASIERKRLAMEAEYKARNEAEKTASEKRQQLLEEQAQKAISGKLEGLFIETKGKIDEVYKKQELLEKKFDELHKKLDELGKNNEALLQAKLESEKNLAIANATKESEAKAQQAIQRAEAKNQAAIQAAVAKAREEMRPQLELELRKKITEEQLAQKALEEQKEQNKKIQEQKAQEEKLQQALEAQRKKGEVADGLFKGANSQSKCVEIFHMNYWRCNGTEGKDCWIQLDKEFKNCLFINVQEGENKYTEETKRLLKVGEEKTK